MLDKGLSTEAFDQVIRAMRDKGREAAEVNQLTGRVSNTTNSVHINARAGELRDRLAAQNDPYREVTERYADDSLDERAMPSFSDLSPRGMARSVINHIASGATAQYRNDVKDRISQIITETNPATVKELVAEVAERAKRDAEFADFLHRAGLFGAKVYGANILYE